MRAGFTLVETLVVLVIIGLLTSVAVMTGLARDSLRDDAEALAARALRAAEESIMSGRPTGLGVTAKGYAFYEMEDGEWRAFAGDRALGPRAWRDGVVVEFHRDGMKAQAPRANLAVAPTVVFDPTGAATRFSITLTERGERYMIAGGEGGTIRVGPP